MHIRGVLVGFLFLSSVMVFSGCTHFCGPEAVLDTIVFPNEWVGDIDKAKFNEPSGICYHTQRKTLFVAGDEGDLCEITTDGTLIKQKRIRAETDFEGITHDPATGFLYLAIEESESLLQVDPETFEVLHEFPLPRQFQGRTLLKAGGEGLEGVTFVPDREHPQGGLFYVANQAFTLSHEEDISAVFVVEAPIRAPNGPTRIVGYFEPGIIDLAALHYDSATDHILVVSDADNLMLEYSRAHKLLNVWAFPGDNQEGVTVDPDGFIYIAQDTGGIIKLKWLR